MASGTNEIDTSPDAPPPPGPTPGRRRDGAALLALSALFLAQAGVAVRHLGNAQCGDTEFTGWTGPLSRHLLAGETLYTDFVLPIPPGSLVLMAAVQRVMGESRLVQELWVAALCHLALALLGWTIAARFLPPSRALLATAGTLASLILLPKELVYDHTAQVVAWASLAAGAWALTGGGRLAWGLAGGFALLTHGFKQSAGVGITLGWATGWLVMGAAALRNGTLRQLGRPLGWFGAGAALGALGVIALLVGVGASPVEFVRSVYGDGPELKGGTATLAENLFRYVTRGEPLPPTVAALVLAGAVVARQAPSPGYREPRAFALPALGLLAAALGLRAVWLWRGWAAPGEGWTSWADRGQAALGAALIVTMAVAVTGWRQRGAREAAWAPLLAVALVASLLFNLSFPLFRPFYDNNPIIPVAWTGLLLALDRARLRWLGTLGVAGALVATLGSRFARLAEADTPAQPGTHWDGLRLSRGGVEVERAATRARALAGEHGTVLVLPEDIQVAALIDRPRPPLRGAVVFVDQYPRRLLEDDLRSFEAALPAVIVLTPSQPEYWRAMFAIWSTNSAAGAFIDAVRARVLPRHYEHDSTYPMRFGTVLGTIEVWRRRQGTPPREH